jgi:hypothetical protein
MQEKGSLKPSCTALFGKHIRYGIWQVVVSLLTMDSCNVLDRSVHILGMFVGSIVGFIFQLIHSVIQYHL